MPSHERTRRFERDWVSLTPTERERFRKAFAPFDEDLVKHNFRPGLRVKRVARTDGVYEMTWAPNGRATFERAGSRAGDVHVLWRRIGTHDVFRGPAHAQPEVRSTTRRPDDPRNVAPSNK